MLKQPADADRVFLLNTMDQTLKDYIDRTMKKLEKENKENTQDQYPVLPKDDGTDSKRNPYSDH